MLMIPKRWNRPYRLVRGALSVWLGLVLGGPAPAWALRSVGLEESNVRDEVAAALNVPSSARHQAAPGLARAGLEEFEEIARALREGGFALTLEPDSAQQAWDHLPPEIRETLHQHLVAGWSLPKIAATRGVPPRTIEREFARGYQALAMTAVRAADRRTKQPWIVSRRTVLAMFGELVRQALPLGTGRVRSGVAPSRLSPDDPSAALAQLFKNKPIAFETFRIRAQHLIRSLRPRKEVLGSADQVPDGILKRVVQLATQHSINEHLALLAETIQLARRPPSNDEPTTTDLLIPPSDQLAGFLLAINREGQRRDTTAEVREIINEITTALQRLARQSPAVGMQVRHFLRDPMNFPVDEAVVVAARAYEIGQWVRQSFETGMPLPDFEFIVEENPQLIGQELKGILRDIEVQLAPSASELLRWFPDTYMDPGAAEAEVMREVEEAGRALGRFRSVYDQLPQGVRQRLGEDLQESLQRVEAEYQARLQHRPEPEEPGALVPAPLHPLAEQIAAQASHGPVRLTVEFDGGGNLVLATFVGGHAEALVREERTAIQAVFPAFVRPGTTWEWIFDQGMGSDAVRDRFMQPWAYARRSTQSPVGIAELTRNIHPNHLVVLEASVIASVEGLDGVIHALRTAGGMDGQILIVPTDASSEILDAFVIGVGNIREQVGALLVTLYGASESRVVTQLRERLESSGIPVVPAAAPPADLLEFLRQLFLALGVPETVATPEAVQQWLAAAGLEEAA